VTAQTPTHVKLGDGQTLTIPLYSGEADVKSVQVELDDPGIPLTVGGTFTGRVVAITREVTER
jgi:hypothetical protein